MAAGVEYTQGKTTIPPRYKYFIEGWWSSDEAGNKRITEALVGDHVYFHVKTKHIPDGKKIIMRLFDDDNTEEEEAATEEEKKKKDKDDFQSLGQTTKIKGIDTYKEVNEGVVKDGKVVRSIILNNLENSINSEQDKQLEFYFRCSYKNEHVELPASPSNYLKVKGIPKIIIVNGQWRLAHYTIGEIITVGPTKPKKPYWVDNFSNYANEYFHAQFQIKNKQKLNNKELSVSELENQNFILYYDGSSYAGGDQSGSDRFANGRKFAEDQYEEIIKGLGGQPIYFVSHSEGGAYAAGMADYLYSKGQTIGEHVLLSPDEGDEFSINPLIPSYQLLYMFFSTIYNPILSDIKYIKFRKWGHYYAIVDLVVNEHKVKGITKMGIVHNQEAGWTGVHGWTNGWNVFDKVSDLKEVQSFLVQGEHKGKFYSGYDQTKTTKNTKFYRVDDEYIITNCPPLIDIK